MNYLVVVALVCISQVAWAGSVTVAVAANFVTPARQIAEAFQQNSEHTVVISSGSTGKLFAQIEHGAPFDLFLAADSQRPRLLEQNGKAVSGSRFTYALGKIVLWSPRPGYVDEHGDILKKGSFKRLALASPRLAPYGLAAQQVMKKLGVWVGLQGRLVQGENIAQAFQFVISGNASLGFVALAQIRAAGSPGSVWQIPGELYQPIRQQAVLLQRGKNSAAANTFFHYLQSGEAREIIRNMGYEVVASGDQSHVAE